MKTKAFFWIPRILAIIAILFMVMFSFDVFSGNEPPGKKILGFLIHNIPAFILIVILVIAWRWEVIGGILFIIAAIAASFFFKSFSGNPGSMIILAPFFITGLLFILHHGLNSRKSP
jgi:hypothetical protein